MSAIHDLIIGWIAMGCTRKEIAGLLHRSLKDVEWHIAGPGNCHSIQKQLGATDPARLTHYALVNGLTELQTCFTEQ